MSVRARTVARERTTGERRLWHSAGTTVADAVHQAALAVPAPVVGPSADRVLPVVVSCRTSHTTRQPAPCSAFHR
ncbi:hypothetical protein ACWEFL_07790 [Streptomyces sp. NPDC004838]